MSCGKTATYLPQVWKNLPDKAAFLSSLSEKAGLKSDDWKNPGTEVLLYRVFEFGEAETT